MKIKINITLSKIQEITKIIIIEKMTKNCLGYNFFLLFYIIFLL